MMHIRSKTTAAAALAISLGLALSACNSAGGDMNRSLYSTKQPVVERHNYTLDVSAGSGGVPVQEQRRLAAWFEAMDLGYGDRVAIDGSLSDSAAQEDIAALAGRHGILLSDEAPVTEGYVDPGKIRVVVSRSSAYVPGCPDWSEQYASNLGNRTTSGFGCSINSNMAAMMADPEHLLKGAEATGDTVVMSSSKAIQTYRDKQPTGAGNLPAVSSQASGGN
ncbi:pilus assembly protein CpaD [Altererythrobacter atlanticus]|uniref:Pilus biogenesis CpaD protein n=1 Tax=Croceibacterium atlanticum TaxID=1267766 RepID=A0A0F7KPM0_9SPHN|nr:CpaD family pilus assembly protein [Croceibacterium atlanticum]AKH42448.1 Pilus biogenesis CpaD protein [Croceibacterium atlanticum]MBB5731225.1 pilus assembly protein CpaD [Croceibacterium atlanticum]